MTQQYQRKQPPTPTMDLPSLDLVADSNPQSYQEILKRELARKQRPERGSTLPPTYPIPTKQSRR